MAFRACVQAPFSFRLSKFNNKAYPSLSIRRVGSASLSFGAAEKDNTVSRNSGSKEKTNILPRVIKRSIMVKDKDKKENNLLSDSFLSKYKNVAPPFGFNGLGELVYRRTYSRIAESSNRHEVWWETIQRVVEGTFRIQERHFQKINVDFKDLEWKRKTAEDMFDRMFHMKFLPPGRGLWAMGTPITEEKGLYTALNNCAFVSTEHMKDDKILKSKPFSFLMDSAMLGVGVGFDLKGAKPDENGKQVVVTGPDFSQEAVLKVIADSREGWVESVANLIDSHFDSTAPPVIFDYSKIRPKGEPIKGFGGVASGPDPLEKLHEEINQVFNSLKGKPLSETSIVDIMNMIGKCVVSGNVRRTAEISFGDYDSEEFMDLKNFEINSHRSEFGWASNNSIYAKLGMDYSKACSRIQNNGEPGFAFLDNMRDYSRMSEPKDYKDYRAMGGNPCLEQTLESYELCCLVETFPHNHTSKTDYLKTLELAFLYAKTVTLGDAHCPESHEVMRRNRRIGCSISGISQFISKRGIHEFKNWCEDGYSKLQEYNTKYSNFFNVQKSIKISSIKPSGTVSLLAGATPGIHYPHSRYHIRRVRINHNSDLIPALEHAGYHVEDDVAQGPTTKVISFPVDNGENIRAVHEISFWEQLSLAAFLQKYWADNQVSCTVTFNPETEGHQLKHALEYFQYQLKGISFLPLYEAGAYPQMPYEKITEQQYNEIRNKIKPLDLHASIINEVIPEKFCDSDFCSI